MALLLEVPSQYDNLMSRLAEVSQQIRDLDRDLRDHITVSSGEKKALERKIDHALNGGNGDGPGIYERFRNIFDWREEHISSHDHSGQERRSTSQDWRRFWLDTAKQSIAVVVAVVAILIVFIVTGKVVALP